MFRRVCQVAVFLAAIALIIAAAERAPAAPADQFPALPPTPQGLGGRAGLQAPGAGQLPLPRLLGDGSPLDPTT